MPAPQFYRALFWIDALSSVKPQCLLNVAWRSSGSRLGVAKVLYRRPTGQPHCHFHPLTRLSVP